MEEYKITVRRGEVFQLPITTDDASAETATMTVFDDSGVVMEGGGTFVDNEVTIDLGEITAPIGEYNYLISIVYSDGVVDILPDNDGCSGDDCESPMFEVCEGIPEGS